jgi:hypothetical protein
VIGGGVAWIVVTGSQMSCLSAGRHPGRGMSCARGLPVCRPVIPPRLVTTQALAPARMMRGGRSSLSAGVPGTAGTRPGKQDIEGQRRERDPGADTVRWREDWYRQRHADAPALFRHQVAECVPTISQGATRRLGRRDGGGGDVVREQAAVPGSQGLPGATGLDAAPGVRLTVYAAGRFLAPLPWPRHGRGG